MDIIDILSPGMLQDTPRLFTGIAEWLAVLINMLIYKKRNGRVTASALACLFFFVQTGFHVLAGFSPISLWIPNMIIAVLLMYGELYIVLDISPMECGFQCIQAFLMAEFSASLYRQLYVWLATVAGESWLKSTLTMIVVYAMSYCVFYSLDKKNVQLGVSYEIRNRDLISALFTGVGVFSLSNLSFIWENTPFSATSNNMLYVRTLVDFGGILMLMTQKSRIYETSISRDNAAINQLFRRQYEQYKLSIDNSEMLRKEMHDLKHYLIVLKNENDPEKKKEYLEELEQEIAIQESFQNTGNQVLDVILTNKSLQCKKFGITLNAMVDGDILQFVHVKDTCALFGNLLDNAIEAVQQVTVPDKKLITLSVKQKNNFVVIECENSTERSLDLTSKSVLPQTTKKDKTLHGYGLKSIRRISEKYDGSMTITQNNEWVNIKVLLTNNTN